MKQMRAIEVTGTIDEKGPSVSRPTHKGRKLLVECELLYYSQKLQKKLENDPDDTPIEEIKS